MSVVVVCSMVVCVLEGHPSGGVTV